MSLRAPTLGGNFAVWGGLFATFDCTYAYLRRREDPWNAIASGATTGGILAARAGWKAMGKNAIIGGVLLAMIEGMGVMMQKMLAPPEPQQAVLAPPSAPGPGAGKGDGRDMGGNVNAPPPPTFATAGTGEVETSDMFQDHTTMFSDEEDAFAFGEMSDDEDGF